MDGYCIIRTEYDTANQPEMTLVQDSGTGSLIYRTALSYDSREHIGSQRERVSGANYATSYTYDWDDRATEIQYGDATHRVRYGYDGQGKPALVSRNGVTYSYLYNLQGDVIGLVDNAGSLVVEYKYNAWGSITGRAGSLSGTLGKLNPFRYRGYVYDEETWMYWLKSR